MSEPAHSDLDQGCSGGLVDNEVIRAAVRVAYEYYGFTPANPTTRVLSHSNHFSVESFEYIPPPAVSQHPQ
jgi:hypothetical protein